MNEQIQQIEAELQRIAAADDVDPHHHLDVLNELVRAIRHFDPQRAALLSDQAYQLALQLDYPQGHLDCLMNLAVLHTHISPNFTVALGWTTQALDWVEHYPNPGVQAYLYQCLATIYRHLGDHPTVHTYLMQGLALARQAGDLALEGLLYNDLGVLYRYTEDYEQGFTAYQQALRIARITDNQHRVALALNNLGDLLHCWGRTPEAIAYLEEAVALTQQFDIKILEPSLLDTLAEIYAAQGDYGAALAYLASARQTADAFDNQFEVAGITRHLAAIYQQQGEWAQALVQLQQALALAEALGLKQEIFTCHELLATTYEALGQPAQALAHYKQFHRSKEELFSEQATQKVKTLQVIHDTAAAKREAEIYRLKNVELQAALDQVKQLSGLLPICGSCKKIRDDSGYWQDVAVYISSHSEAEFSHGICPDCMAQLYPEYHQKRLAKAA